MLSVDDASVDEEWPHPIWTQSVWAGKCTFSTMFYLRSESEKAVAEDKEEEKEIVKLRLGAFDSRDWSFQGIEDETFILNIDE